MVEYIFSSPDDKFTHRIFPHECGICICGARVHAKTIRQGNTFAVCFPGTKHSLPDCAEKAVSMRNPALMETCGNAIIREARKTPTTYYKRTSKASNHEARAVSATNKSGKSQQTQNNTIRRIIKNGLYEYDPNTRTSDGILSNILMTPWWLEKLCKKVEDIDRYVTNRDTTNRDTANRFNMMHLVDVMSFPTILFRIHFLPQWRSESVKISFELSLSDVDVKDQVRFWKHFVYSGPTEQYKYITRPRDDDLWFAVYCDDLHYEYRAGAGITFVGTIAKLQNVIHAKKLKEGENYG